MADPLVDLAARLGARCAARGLTVATAESCTGGLVAHLITEVPGSSAYLRGGIVAYADDVKRDRPGRPRRRPRGPRGRIRAGRARDGGRRPAARSAPTSGSRSPGVAGPDGGSEAKPVGLVYVAVAGLGPAGRPPVPVVGRPRRQQAEPARRRRSGCSWSGWTRSPSRDRARRRGDRGRARCRARPARPIVGRGAHPRRRGGRGRRLRRGAARGVGGSGRGRLRSGRARASTRRRSTLAGVRVAPAHDAAHVRGVPHPARLAVTKALTAIDPDHPELLAARELGRPARAVAAGGR